VYFAGGAATLDYRRRATENVFVDPGAKAIDTLDGDISAYICVTVNVTRRYPNNTVVMTQVNAPLSSVVATEPVNTLFTIRYVAQDFAGNRNQVQRAVVIVDVTPPVISLNGEAGPTVMFGVPYTDPGAVADDFYDGVRQLNVTNGTVQTATPGWYLLTYRTKDVAGNVAEPKVRNVTVDILRPPTAEFRYRISFYGDVATPSTHQAYVANITGYIARKVDGNFLFSFNSSVVMPMALQNSTVVFETIFEFGVRKKTSPFSWILAQNLNISFATLAAYFANDVTVTSAGTVMHVTASASPFPQSSSKESASPAIPIAAAVAAVLLLAAGVFVVLLVIRRSRRSKSLVARLNHEKAHKYEDPDAGSSVSAMEMTIKQGSENQVYAIPFAEDGYSEAAFFSARSNSYAMADHRASTGSNRNTRPSYDNLNADSRVHEQNSYAVATETRSVPSYTVAHHRGSAGRGQMASPSYNMLTSERNGVSQNIYEGSTDTVGQPGAYNVLQRTTESAMYEVLPEAPTMPTCTPSIEDSNKVRVLFLETGERQSTNKRLASTSSTASRHATSAINLPNTQYNEFLNPLYQTADVSL
jgi:hypothetical protein